MTLPERAHAAGVSVDYEDWAGRRTTVAPDVVEKVLAQVGDPAPSRPHTGVSLPAVPRCWGWQIQLYALHSQRSWGIGDFADLRDVAVWAAAQGAGLVLVNPLHAVAPVHPIEASPYSPTSRRFLDVLSICVPELPEYVAATDDVRRAVDALRPTPSDLVDRDAVWRAKSAACVLLQPDWIVFHDPDLCEFALYCALAEKHGKDWHDWPLPLRNREPSALDDARRTFMIRWSFHAWLQLRAEQQAGGAQAAALEAGMAVGIVHDLAVGVDPGGADAWMLQEVLAPGVTVGAPPDSFNQRGQDWALPPWRPGALARAGYEPLRQMITAVLGRGGGVRVDHVMGLFRLWWIPAGVGPGQGAYVSYDAEAMLDVVCGAAVENDGIVVGEDLGTVEPAVRQALSRRGVLGSAVLWFERVEDDPLGPPKPVGDWRADTMASISTHDLPTAVGYLTGEHVRVRAELGLLGRALSDERADHEQERSALLQALVDEGVLASVDAPLDDVVVAMHAYLGRTPSTVVLAAPYDVVGETRQPNLPGTTDAYPNWRIPLPLSLEELRADARVAVVSTVLRAARP
ncbi:MAG TPA: 4-alpha-glucanotransferase [Mycobacteriales bacterium]